jgi:hypothetical protein
MFEIALSRAQVLKTLLWIYFPIIDMIFVSGLGWLLDGPDVYKTAGRSFANDTPKPQSHTSSGGPARAGEEKEDYGGREEWDTV